MDQVQQLEKLVIQARREQAELFDRIAANREAIEVQREALLRQSDEIARVQAQAKGLDGRISKNAYELERAILLISALAIAILALTLGMPETLVIAVLAVITGGIWCVYECSGNG